MSSGPGAIVTPGHPYSTAGRETEPGLEDYPHIFSTDVWDPSRFWYTERPNILNQRVSSPEWDAMEIINTDRPDFTDVATVVGKGVTQIETGYTYRYRSDSDVTFNRQTMPESLLRIGVTDRFEWRIKWDGGYTNTRTYDNATGGIAAQDGFSDTVVGFKWEMIDQDDWRPLQTLVARLGIPTGTNHFSAYTVQPGATYIYNWQVRRWWFIRGSSGLDWLNGAGPAFTPGVGGGPIVITDSRDYQVQGHQSVSSYMQISQRFGMFAEWFLLYHKDAANNYPDHYHDYGLYIYATPNFQYDVRIGQRLGPHIQEYFTGAGVSLRLK